MGERDYDLLELSGLSSYLTADHLARSGLFPNPDRARRRARALFDAELLNVTLVGSARASLYSLSRKGLALLARERPGVAASLHLPGPVRLSAVPHRLAIVDARLFCSALGQLRGSPLARYASGGGEWARSLGLPDLGVAPDALAEFTTPDGPVVIAIEVDCGTESLPVIKAKMTRVAPAATDGRLDALWYVADAGPARAAGIERVVADAGLDLWARVLPLAFVNERPVRDLPERAGGGGSGRRPENASPTRAQNGLESSESVIETRPRWGQR